MNKAILAYGVFCIPADSQRVGLQLSRDKKLIWDYVVPFALNFMAPVDDEIREKCRRKLLLYIAMTQNGYWRELNEKGIVEGKDVSFPDLTKIDLSCQDCLILDEAHKVLCSIDGYDSLFNFSNMLLFVESCGDDYVMDQEWVRDFVPLLDMTGRLWESFLMLAKTGIDIVSMPDQIAVEIAEYFDHVARSCCYFLQDDQVLSHSNIKSAKSHLERTILDIHKAIVFSLLKYTEQTNNGNWNTDILKKWLKIRQKHIFWDNGLQRLRDCINFTAELYSTIEEFEFCKDVLIQGIRSRRY